MAITHLKCILPLFSPRYRAPERRFLSLPCSQSAFARLNGKDSRLKAQLCVGPHGPHDGGFLTMSIEVLSSSCMCSKTLSRLG